MIHYGDRKRVELARCVAMEPRLMLLDEPVASMSAAERAAMTALLAEGTPAEIQRDERVIRAYLGEELVA